ncbi:Putative uncharacterized protein [Streptococcus gallolyticus]|uniref:Uncharacterized protein n=2 Tax=Streptococcus gallolyticus TaxID=315405 RepID=A0AA36JWR2_STRG3|nr:conserved hypothetical protein [Streptococcus gallolyticus UCN34]CDO16826.1 Putative uncharacterized protein [Streptococcus gallolyticus]
MLWHTNSHQCVDRLNICISGNSSLSPVCKPLHAEATKEKRVAHLLVDRGFNTNRESRCQYSFLSFLSSVGRAVDS